MMRTRRIDPFVCLPPSWSTCDGLELVPAALRFLMLYGIRSVKLQSMEKKSSGKGQSRKGKIKSPSSLLQPFLPSLPARASLVCLLSISSAPDPIGTTYLSMEVLCVTDALHPATLQLLQASLHRVSATSTFIVNGGEPTAAGRAVCLMRFAQDGKLTTLLQPSGRWDLRRGATAGGLRQSSF